MRPLNSISSRTRSHPTDNNGTLDTTMADTKTFLPPKFDGTQTEARAWLEQYTLYVRHTKLNETAQACAFPLLLEGAASKWYTGLPPGQKEDSDTLIEALKQHFFENTASLWARQKKLLSKGQRAGQSVLDYIMECRYEAMGLDLTEKQLVSVIMGGIDSSVRPFIAQNNPQKVDENITAGQLLDRTAKSANMASENEALALRVSLLEARLQAVNIASQGSRGDDQYARPPVDQTRAGGPHTRQPWARNADPPGRRQSPQENATWTGQQRLWQDGHQGRCANCGGFGHRPRTTQCRAFNKSCHYCHKLHHLQSCCITAKRQKDHYRQ